MKLETLYANPIVGRTGLGNMLFPWARAEVFCKNHDARMLAPQWVNVCRVGPWLRRERDKRYYLSSFSNSGYVHGLYRQYVLHLIGHVGEAEFSKRQQICKEGRSLVVDFKGMDGFFSPFLDAQAYVKERLYAITSPAIVSQVEQFSDEPFIGVHIRRGDFKYGGIAIDDAWYVRAIEVAAKSLNTRPRALPIRIFSDAAPETLQFLADGFSNVTFMPKAPALLDMLLLSRCRALVGTSRSTFSMWAAFLGQMPSFWHPSQMVPIYSALPQAAVTMIN
jgi:hypothetical protein